MIENPGAYNEARDRIREKEKNERVVLEERIVDFEKSKEKLRKGRKLDVFELKRRIETGRSLSTLKTDIEHALKEGAISFETYQKTLRSLENRDKLPDLDENALEIVLSKIPFQDNKIAQYFENQKFSENLIIDLLGMMYGFFVQGSALLVILLWNMILDLIKLPRDISIELRSPH